MCESSVSTVYYLYTVLIQDNMLAKDVCAIEVLHIYLDFIHYILYCLHGLE